MADGTLTYENTDGRYVPESSIKWSGYNITIEGQFAGLNVNTGDHLKLWVSDDGVNNLFNGNWYGQSATALYVPDVTIANYTTVDIYLPYESAVKPMPSTRRITSSSAAPAPTGTPGTYGFNDIPVTTANASVNFYDNTSTPVDRLPAAPTIWCWASPSSPGPWTRP